MNAAYFESPYYFVIGEQKEPDDITVTERDPVWPDMYDVYYVRRTPTAHATAAGYSGA